VTETIQDPVVELAILHQDDHIVIVDKPSGMPVHRSKEHARVRTVAMQTLRDQLGRHVFPVHRLDRATSGVLLFALSSESARTFQEALSRPDTEKRYVAIVRGAVKDETFTVERPLTNKESGNPQHSCSHFRRLAVFQVGDRFGDASLVEARIETGRRHQIRRHLSGLRHQVLVDSNYGKGAINRYARDELGFSRMCLHAYRLRLYHPHDESFLTVTAPLPSDVADPLARLLPRDDWPAELRGPDAIDAS
jgi:tRNA pseudouridine65 synthase